MGNQPLLIALVATQFLVHALGWSMAAQLTRRWKATEGLFVAVWLLGAAGLMLYVPALPSGSWPRNLGNVLLIASIAVQHWGMALYWGQRPAVRLYAAVLVLAMVVNVLSFPLAYGHGLRVAMVCIGVAVLQLATVHLVWRRGRATTPTFAAVLAGGYGALALALLARAVQALTVAPSVKISIDAPGHLNVPLAISVLFLGGLINLAQIRLVLGRVLSHLTTQALTDVLTGAANRRGLMQQLEEEHARTRQGTPPYAVMMVDVDHFKAVNDEHGHDEGDQVLQRVAHSLRDGVRDGDVVARWGGEEFCVLMPRIGVVEAQALAERVAVQVAASGQPRVTVSIGIARCELGAEPAEGVIRRADAALYRAKQAGRNRVVADYSA
jgi:diguanylate cyclase (GGDEF)-like protein